VIIVGRATSNGDCGDAEYAPKMTLTKQSQASEALWVSFLHRPDFELEKGWLAFYICQHNGRETHQ